MRKILFSFLSVWRIGVPEKNIHSRKGRNVFFRHVRSIQCSISEIATDSYGKTLFRRRREQETELPTADQYIFICKNTLPQARCTLYSQQQGKCRMHIYYTEYVLVQNAVANEKGALDKPVRCNSINVKEKSIWISIKQPYLCSEQHYQFRMQQ
jgi:hypothetical protein